MQTFISGDGLTVRHEIEQLSLQGYRLIPGTLMQIIRPEYDTLRRPAIEYACMLEKLDATEAQETAPHQKTP